LLFITAELDLTWSGITGRCASCHLFKIANIATEMKAINDPDKSITTAWKDFDCKKIIV
jgi:hypothetical protein